MIPATSGSTPCPSPISSSSITSIEYLQGFTLVRLTSGRCSVAVIPELGAKIVSLTDHQTSREWMWHPPGPLRLWRNAEGEPFLRSTFVGADECIPTISPCSQNGRELPDHGEVWSAGWKLDEHSLSQNIIRTAIQLPRSPFHLERSVTVDHNTIRLDYRLTNTSDGPETWLWALHPLLSFEPDDQLELPPEIRQVRVYAARQPAFPPGALLDWPAPAAGINLRELRLGGDDSYLKCFAGPFREGWARIANPRTSDSITFRWDATSNPFLGIWLTRGGFNGWHHPALEPTNAMTDSLADNAHQASRPVLGPKATRLWRVELTAGTD